MDSQFYTERNYYEGEVILENSSEHIKYNGLFKTHTNVHKICNMCMTSDDRDYNSDNKFPKRRFLIDKFNGETRIYCMYICSTKCNTKIDTPQED